MGLFHNVRLYSFSQTVNFQISFPMGHQAERLIIIGLPSSGLLLYLAGRKQRQLLGSLPLVGKSTFVGVKLEQIGYWAAL